MQSTCWTLVKAAAGGDAAQRESFARRYQPVIRAYLQHRWRALAARDELEDAIQEVFLECFREGGILERVRMEAPGGFRAFLYGTARNVALRFEERWSRREAGRVPASDLDLVDRNETSLSEALDRAWARAILREAADLLAERAEQKGEAARRRVEILRLRFAEELPIRDIAARWGVSAEALYQDQFRARQEYKESLREVVAFHHGGNAEDVERECARLQDLLE